MPQPPRLDQIEARIREPHPGVPHGFKGPGTLAERWIGNRTSRTQTGACMVCWRCMQQLKHPYHNINLRLPESDKGIQKAKGME